MPNLATSHNLWSMENWMSAIKGFCSFSEMFNEIHGDTNAHDFNDCAANADCYDDNKF